MLISHEVPLALLQESKSFNDYDYCLLHLLSRYPAYREFYKQSVQDGRKVLLDNSLFELGDALSKEQLIEGILDIQPTWYVVPDCWEDAKTTIQRFEEFKPYIKDLPGKAIGVVQGSTFEDLIKCYSYMSGSAEKVAFPFGIKGYIDVYEKLHLPEMPSDDVPVLWKLHLGRQFFIKHLIEKNLWCCEKPHHLLGCNFAREFLNPIYHDPKFNVESCDTSNPIVAGLIGLKYDGVNGLDMKPLIKMNDLMEISISKVQRKCIYDNIKIFRDIAGDKK